MGTASSLSSLRRLVTVIRALPELRRAPSAAAANMAMLWILNLSDVTYSVLDIAERARLPFAVIVMTARLLKQNGLLRNAESKVPSQDPSRHN